MRLIDTPICINGLEISNRLVMPPMATSKATREGLVTEALCDYYNEKTAGGYIGLVITEHAYISKEGKASEGQLSLDPGCDIDGLKKLTGIIHANNSVTFCQLNHAGGAASYEVTGKAVKGASSFPLPGAKAGKQPPLEMSLSDIEDTVKDFASAAVRAKNAGYDGVEIHSAHGYLLNQFYSPLTNHRTDSYTGKTIEGRLKFLLQVMSAVREAVGAGYPVAVRLGACDYTEGGSTEEDAVIACKALEKAGADLLDISGGFCGFTNPYNREQGYFSGLTGKIKENVSVPVILTGGIVDVQAAEMLLESGKADMTGVGRAVLKDSGWAERAMKR